MSHIVGLFQYANINISNVIYDEALDGMFASHAVGYMFISITP